MIIFNALQTSLSAGIGRTSYGIGKALYEEKKIKVKLVIREEDIELYSFADLNDLIIAKGINNSLKRNYYEQLILPKIVKRNYPNSIIYFADTMGPILSRVPFIITINDLAFKSLKKSFSLKSTIWKSIITYLSVKRCKHIVTISEFSKNEVLKHYKYIDNNKISPIHIGFNNFSNEKINLNLVRDKIKDKINYNYIFTVSTISPRKNMHRLVEAFNIIKDDIDSKLIISGKNGWMYDEVYDLVKKYKLNDRVIFTGGINDEELKILYKNCEVFVYPSLYEGFGLPPLEAISYDKLVIASNTTAMPEVLKDSAIYIDPLNIDDIAEKIKDTIINKEKIINIKKDYKQLLDNYSWKNFSIEFSRIYDTF